MALLSTYRFLLDSEEELIKHFYRIARTIRGIGDPLIATYARCYLARKGVELIPREKRYLILCFDDFLTTLKQWEDSAFIDTIKNAGMEMHQYLDLYSPAIEWILEALGNHGDEVTSVIDFNLHFNRNYSISYYKSMKVSQRNPWYSIILSTHLTHKLYQIMLPY